MYLILFIAWFLPILTKNEFKKLIFCLYPIVAHWFRKVAKWKTFLFFNIFFWIFACTHYIEFANFFVNWKIFFDKLCNNKLFSAFLGVPKLFHYSVKIQKRIFFSFLFFSRGNLRYIPRVTKNLLWGNPDFWGLKVDPRKITFSAVLP